MLKGISTSSAGTSRLAVMVDEVSRLVDSNRQAGTQNDVADGSLKTKCQRVASWGTDGLEE